LKRVPRHPYTYGMLTSFPTLHGPRRYMTGIPGSPPDLRELPPGCAFHPRCPMAFPTCSTALPVLKSVASAEVTAPFGGGQQVACHLYGASEPPSVTDFAKGYEAAYAALADEGMGE
jgi:peptide/nickel transport system ATP-binding protein